MEKLAREAMTFPAAPRRGGFKLWLILDLHTSGDGKVAGKGVSRDCNLGKGSF